WCCHEPALLRPRQSWPVPAPAPGSPRGSASRAHLSRHARDARVQSSADARHSRRRPTSSTPSAIALAYSSALVPDDAESHGDAAVVTIEAVAIVGPQVLRRREPGATASLVLRTVGADAGRAVGVRIRVSVAPAVL